MGYLGGIVVGAAVILLVVGLMRLRKTAERYDERQAIRRGEAYTTGFFVTVLLCIISGLAVLFEPSLGHLAMPLLMGSAFAGAIVAVVQCIWTEAYFPARLSGGRYFVLTALVGVINLLVAIFGGDYQNVEEFLTSASFVNACIALEFLVALAALAVRLGVSRNGEE